MKQSSVEVRVSGRGAQFSVDDFGQPGSDQAPYDEALLSVDGEAVLSCNECPSGDVVRLAFFLHFFDPDKPLLSSYGEVPVPPVQPMPGRLRKLVPYVPVD